MKLFCKENCKEKGFYSILVIIKKDTGFNIGSHNVSCDIKVDADELPLDR